MEPVDRESPPAAGETGDRKDDAVPAGATRGRIWASALAFGLLAGLAAWGAGELTVDWFPPERREIVGAMGLKSMDTTVETRNASEAKTGVLAAGLLGAALGLGLGLAGGCARRSAGSAAAAGVLGLTLAAAAGAGVTLAVLRPYFAAHKYTEDEILPALLVHGLIWLAVGAAAGAAFGLGAGGWRRVPRALIGGAAGAAIGATLYEMVGAAAFPLAMTTRLVSLTWGSRLFASLSACLAASLGLALALDPGRKRPAEAKETAG